MTVAREITGDKDTDFQTVKTVWAPAERVFAALGDTDAISGWWGPATGSTEVGDTFVVSFQEGKQQITMHAAPADEGHVLWQVESAPLTPEWAGTTIDFHVAASEGGCTLHFRHHGLTPRLECFDMCFAGWTHYVDSLVAYAETGTGRPERHGRGRARTHAQQ